MIEEGRYIYCIIEENKDQRLSFLGINNREISTLHYKDIAAVVSPTPVINFDRLDKKELIKHVAVHQKVQEVVMEDYDVCPMTFGIIAPSADEVLRILEKAYLQFKTALKKTEGKAEFAVQVWWDQKKLLNELININPEIRKLKQELFSKGSILGMPIKLKLGKLIHQGVETRRKAYFEDIQAALSNLAEESTSNKLIDDACPVGPAPFGKRAGSFGEMIANLSFLIEKIKEPELDKKMQEIGKRYEGKLRFKYIGPMPLYSFSDINLGLGNFEIIDEARKLLGLGEEATFDEIKNAYYALSHKYHPDKYGGKSATAEQMKKINKACCILENYCQSCAELLGQKNQKYSFKKEDVKNSIMIKI